MERVALSVIGDLIIIIILNQTTDTIAQCS